MNAVLLLKKYFTDPAALYIVLEHSRLVAAKALQVADMMTNAAIDRIFLEEAALLHDIGVCRTASPGIGCHGPEPYICHGIIGREILEQEGLPRHALVCERHIGVGLTVHDIRVQNLPLPERDMSPVAWKSGSSVMPTFFSRKTRTRCSVEKSIESVQENLARFGAGKVTIFNGWTEEFRCR